VLIFSIGGQRKIEIAAATDFRSKFEAAKADVARRKPQTDSSEDSPMSSLRSEAELEWEDVFHVVVVANYKEHLHTIREAVDSVAMSPLARSQICVVFAMEEREQGCDEKADTLIAEYRPFFRDIFATFHPDGLPGEVPSKASNMHWATARVSEYIARHHMSSSQVLFTVADADSDFHPKYFCALTEAFLCAGASRVENIWQPPIINIKNYYEQPGCLRFSTLITGQHELANLADELCTALPFSSYSIPLRFLKAIEDFDPDWLSEDWHIGLKCRLATCGKCHVRPIMLPVINYTPEDETYWKTIYARWQQAKRHALGFSELAYIWGSIPLAVVATRGSPNRLGKLASFFFEAICPLAFKVIAVHGILGTMILLAPLNMHMLWHFWNTGQASMVGSWTYMVNFTATSISGFFYASALLTGINLFEHAAVQPRIVLDNSGERPWWVNSRIIHFFRLFFCEYLVWGPVMFAVAGAAEWIAAVRSIGDHRFTHVVALKPPTANNSSTNLALLGGADNTEEQQDEP